MSRLEDYEWMLHYLKVLDPINAKIIEGLGEHPRNLSLLAEKIGFPSSTVAFRLKALIRQGYLTVRAKLNSPKLGLMKVAVIADTNRGFSDTLLKAIENVGYWSYIAGCYGKFNGFYALLSFPFAYKPELEDYFEKAKMLGATSDYVLLWTTNIYEVAPNFDWFDFKRKAWNFVWQEWVEGVQSSSDVLPKRLVDPENFKVDVDYLDLLILKELEIDGFRDFTQLSKVVKITPQAVRHRYYQHVIGRNLITGYEVAIFPYPLQVSDLCAFILDFPDQKALAKFANSLVDKPFVLSYAKVVGKNSLLVHFYVPKTEFSNFMASLNSLTVEEIVQDLFHVSIDVKSFKRQTVSYEHFQDGRWEYNHAEEIKKLVGMMPLKLKTHSSPL
jgi:DNA-binding Lrp family transcriptional regulator